MLILWLFVAFKYYPFTTCGGFYVFLVIDLKDVGLLFVKAGEFSLHCYLGYCICSCSPYLDDFGCFAWFPAVFYLRT